MTLLSITKLVEITGKTSRTVNKRLEKLESIPSERAGILYDSKIALPLIYELSGMSPQDEKARLDRLRADKVELDIKIATGELVKLDEISDAWVRSGTNTKTKILNVPTKIAPLVIGCKTIPQVKEIVDKALHEALADFDGPAPGTRTRKKILFESEATTKVDSKPVGRRKKKAVG